ncbi:Ldh family oxidoreductase [Paracoccus fontiphilus]|uniref:Ldh family oxidoreductase n=1 Tax=Paracoccus fontiphilus TaxID=1815556 RepID=UPI001A9745C9|nr:Ldh family oxidoreductase [Paracoccus fontiphilus]
MPTHRDIEAAALAALVRAGVPADQAALQVELLLEAELRGTASHGMLRLPRVVRRILNGVSDPVAKGLHDWAGQALLHVDGQGGLGPVVAMHALEAAADRVARTGSVTVAIRNCNHLGMLGFYAERMARRGFVLLGFTVSEALVHPWGGRRAMIGTNPVAIGVPAEPQPFVLDLATSLVSMGKIHDHANRGAPIPDGWALDAAGNPTTDAAAARDGALAPFGGAKGYALGLGFELLVTALAGSAIGGDVSGTLDDGTACNKGDVFILFAPQDGMAARIGAYLQALRDSAPLDGAHPVRIPGDRALQDREARLNGDLPLPDDIWNQIRALAGRDQLETTHAP